MNKTVYRLSLDMQSNVCQRELNMRKKESGRQIVATIRDGFSHYHIADDCRAVFAAKKPDGKILFNECTIKGCDVIYDVTEQTTVVPGITECEFRIYGGDGMLITSPKFAIKVSDTVYDDGDEIESASEFSALTSALTEVNLLIEEVKNLGNDIDPEVIAEALAEYLAVNPIQETDPTVPAWAKQPTKPEYTAAEVGAVATVNGIAPDESGNVQIPIPDSGQNVELDTTLTQRGKAADAKSVGDALGNIERQVQAGVTDEQVRVAVNTYLEDNPPEETEVSIFLNKTASFYGDSLTEANYHYSKGYHKWVQDILGLASYNNYGKSGYKVSDVYNKVNSVTDAADVVFVMCGVNDQNFSVPLGTLGDTTTGTTYGALNLLCALLKQKYPTSIVVFITPHYQTRYKHSGGITSYEISKAVKEVCEKYAIPVYDNFVLSSIYSTNLSTFTTDNCHWNDTAHEMVGKNLARFMVDTFRYIYGDTAGGDTHTHSYTGTVTTAATCTTAGVKVFTCECGESYTESIPATGHSWNDGAVTVEPTEETEGVKTYTCTVCGETYSETIPALDHEHSYASTVIAPTCTEQGYTEHICSCGDSYKDTYVEATGHNYVNGVCSACGADDPDYNSITFQVINNSVQNVSYADGVLNLVVNNGSFGGVVFEGATEFTIDLTGVTAFPWVGVRDGNVYHTHARTGTGGVDSFDWSDTLSPTKMTSGGIALAIITTVKVEGESVNFYNGDTGELLTSHPGDAIVMISSYTRPTTWNVTIK